MTLFQTFNQKHIHKTVSQNQFRMTSGWWNREKNIPCPCQKPHPTSLLVWILVRAAKCFCKMSVSYSFCCLGVVSGVRGVWIRTLLLRSESSSTVLPPAPNYWLLSECPLLCRARAVILRPLSSTSLEWMLRSAVGLLICFTQLCVFSCGSNIVRVTP